MRVPFSKYAGCGNDFILIDDRNLFFPLSNKDKIQQLCNRQKGIGADGLILLQKSYLTDYRMRYFNADGLEAEMCGNGIRCLMKFIQEIESIRHSCSIETQCGNLELSVQGDKVSVEMPSPHSIQWQIPFSMDQKENVHYLNTGVPHVVLFVDQLDTFNLEKWGPYVRSHPTFSPQGTNFNIAQLTDAKVRIRTFERGVEAETLACGTGAVAVALSAAFLNQISSPILIETASREIIAISFKNENGQFHQIKMVAPAVKNFEGSFTL